MIEIEGYFDNVVLIIYGGLIVGYYNDVLKEMLVVYIDILDVDVIVMILIYELKIEVLRCVLL